MNRAVLAAFLCSATAPATMCEPGGQISPFNEGQWATLADAGATTSSTMVAPTSLTEEAMQITDATVVLRERIDVDMQPVEETTARANTLPSTSTAPANTLPCTSTAPDPLHWGLR